MTQVTQDIARLLAEGLKRLGKPYPDPDRSGCYRVPVVSGKYPGMEVLVDADVLRLVGGRRWNFSCGSWGRGMGAGSVVLAGKGTPLVRILMGVVDDPERQVSHVNGDKLDCRRENLIVRTRSEVALARKPSPEAVARLTPYPDADRPGVWRVPLKSRLADREVLIDEADLPVVEGKRWNWSSRGDEEGRTEGVVVLATTGRQLPLHRLIANVTDPKMRVAFVNGDALDCRRANLVVRTLAETVQATRKRSMRGAGKACTSAFKGVCFDPERGQWVAQIRKGRVGMLVGRFDTELNAAIAYDASARVLYGAHAHLNFPEQPSSEQALAEAQRATDSAFTRRRMERRRQREIEGDLRRAARDSEPVTVSRGQTEGDDATALIPGDTARQLFDVAPGVWERWQRFGWLPAGVTVEGGISYVLADVQRLLVRCGIVALPYPDPQRTGVYRVPLSGETAQAREALIDADAVPLVRTRRWRFAATDTGRGGEVQTMNPAENIRLHYVVMGIGSDAEHHIGHRNDDPLDCRRENLVVRTLTDTASNRRKQATFRGRPCTSRFKGVFWDARRGRWVAKIKKDRVSRQLGSFRDEIAAAEAYDEAARELFGEHARPNFPDGVEQVAAAIAA